MEKFSGRPKGAANKSNRVLRDRILKQQRVSEGFDMTIGHLKEVLPAGTSVSDILHEALQVYGLQKLSKKIHIQWLKQIK